MNSPNVFLLSWDNTGIEAVINISEKEAENAWNVLADKPTSFRPGTVVQHLLLRARYNTQRHYEIYTLQVDAGITESDVREMFESDPQYAADLVRERGHKLYSDRTDKSKIKIE